MARFGDWLNLRLGHRKMIQRVTLERVPGGASFAYVLGSATLVVFLLQAITGVWQLFFYVPSVDHAYDSVNYLRFDVPFGWLIHGIHFWGAATMVVLVVLHLARVFIWGAYKHERELVWLLGVGLLLSTLMAVFTGGPLPWDERGYWAAQVGANIVGSIPLVGNALKQLLWGGQEVGQLSLTRFYGAHVAIVPLLIAAFIALHVATFMRMGSSGPMDEKRRSRRSGRFWPNQAVMDAMTSSAIFLALVGLSAFLLTPVAGPADPIDITYQAKPYWAFLFLYQTLKYFPGRWEPLATVVLPTVGLALLIAVPWIDRARGRTIPERKGVIAVGALVGIAILALTIMGAASTEPSGASASAAAGSATSAPEPSVVNTTTTGPSQASLIIGGAGHGSVIFEGYCRTCHGAEGVGGVDNPGSDDGTVPPLAPIDSELKSSDPQKFVDAIDPYLQNGSVPEGPHPKLHMPAFGATDSLTQQQISDVEAYVLELNGVDRAQIQKPGMRPQVFFWVSLGLFGIAMVLGAWGLMRR